MKKTPAALAAFAALVAFSFGPGCGGAGGGLFGDDDGVTICPAGTFAPSYAASIDLARFPALPVTVAFANRTTYGDTDLRDVIRDGMDEWVAGTGGVIRYSVIEDLDDADVVITINVVSARPGVGGELGYTETRLTDQRVNGATVRMDAWDGMTPAEIFQGFRSTAAHEFGHALGILDHSDQEADVMFYGHAPDEGTRVSARDVNTIKTAYCTEFGRSRSAAAPPCPENVPCREGERSAAAAPRVRAVCGDPNVPITVAPGTTRALRLP